LSLSLLVIVYVAGVVFLPTGVPRADEKQPTAAATPRQIFTAGESGAYHTVFCPTLVDALAEADIQATCTPTLGTEDNMRRVLEQPRALAFAQFDLLALDRPAYGGADALSVVRLDDARECIYAVARNENLKSFGDLATRASRLRFILPPARSGSAGTFRFLQSLDPDLARAGDVRHVATTEEAIRLALSADDTVAIFVQFPDPSNKRFQLVGELGGTFIPVIDRALLSQKVDGQYIYFAQETEVANPHWLKSGTSLLTSCTPLALITGNPARIAEPDARAAQAEMIDKIRAIPAEAMRPTDGLLSVVWKRTKALSASAVEKIVALSEKAREKTAPLIEKAQEATTKALEGAKPHVESAKEAGTQTLERAKETVKDLIAPEKPAADPPGPPH